MPEAHCNCGAIKITTPTATESILCHCTDCRRFTGSLFATYVSFPRNEVKMSGLPSMWAKVADSGRSFERYFCGGCGSSLFDVGQMERDVLYIHGGILPPGSVPSPTMDIFRRNADSWDKEVVGCKVFAGQPE